MTVSAARQVGDTMGQGTWIDSEAVLGGAASLAETAEALASAAASTESPAFGPGSAGRSYGDLGDRIAQGYDRIGAAVGAWSAVAQDVADAIEAAVRDYELTDDAAAADVGRTEGER